MFIGVNKNYFEYHKCVDIMCIDITKGRRNSMDFVYTDQHGVTKIFKMLSPLSDGVSYSGFFLCLCFYFLFDSMKANAVFALFAAQPQIAKDASKNQTSDL